ncbi:hypothetical protein ACP4OV_012273 [Aristida adscensionis]
MGDSAPSIAEVRDGGRSPVPTTKKVCVVGAGMSGLAAARELRHEGHAVTVMEQGSDVGGQWLYDPRTDAAGGGAAAAPVKVHSSMYASVRLMSPREWMGFSDFQFVPRPGAGRDGRRYPGHREVFCYLKDFYHAFGLAGVVRLNTKVVHVGMAPPHEDGDGLPNVKWVVISVHVEPESREEGVVAEEVFDAVVVASGHYSQPKLPTINGMEEWKRRQLHSHSYRVPAPFHDQVVVVVGCGESGLDLALELSGVAREVHLSANKSMKQTMTPAMSKMLAKYRLRPQVDHLGEDEAAMTPAMSRMLANHGDMRLHPQVDRLCEDGTVAFADGSRVVADAVIYCTGYTYSFPFLDAAGLVTVDGNRVGPLYEHVFPPALAPALSFVGVPMRVFAPWVFEAQARWVARVLSGGVALPPVEEMLRAVQERYHAMEVAGEPTHYTHVVGREVFEYVYRISGGVRVRVQDLGSPAHGGLEDRAVLGRHSEHLAVFG